MLYFLFIVYQKSLKQILAEGLQTIWVKKYVILNNFTYIATANIYSNKEH